jgi:hypothetical protein
MKELTTFTTGSRRGYICVDMQGVESDVKKIPESLKGLRGNMLRALRALRQAGATYYTTANYQGVPSAGYAYSTLFCYTTYTGYTD